MTQEKEETKKKHLQELLELARREAEGIALSKEELQRKMKLLHLHKEFIGMSADQLRKKLEPKSIALSSDDPITVDSITQDYNKKYSQQPWYEKPIEDKDGNLHLKFPSDEEAGSFFKSQAEKGQRFALVDKNTNKVLAYSSGDGKLYHGDGTAYDGGNFKPSTESHAEFKANLRAREQEEQPSGPSPS